MKVSEEVEDMLAAGAVGEDELGDVDPNKYRALFNAPLLRRLRLARLESAARLTRCCRLARR